jgi:hypothetical protein
VIALGAGSAEETWQQSVSRECPSARRFYQPRGRHSQERWVNGSRSAIRGSRLFSRLSVALAIKRISRVASTRCQAAPLQCASHPSSLRSFAACPAVGLAEAGYSPNQVLRIAKPSSRNCRSVTSAGASIIRSWPRLFLGNGITSRMFVVPVIIIKSRSIPRAIPP